MPRWMLVFGCMAIACSSPAGPATPSTPAQPTTPTTPVPKDPNAMQPTPAILAVTFETETGSLPPPDWRRDTLTITNALAVEYTALSHYGDTTVEAKQGAVTQAQYDDLASALGRANFTQVPAARQGLTVPGSSSRQLTVKTDGGTFVHRDNSKAGGFSPDIAAVFERWRSLKP